MDLLYKLYVITLLSISSIVLADEKTIKEHLESALELWVPISIIVKEASATIIT